MPAKNPYSLSREEISLLSWAIFEAEGWRGAIQDKEERAAFNKRISAAKAALARVKQLNSIARNLPIR